MTRTRVRRRPGASLALLAALTATSSCGSRGVTTTAPEPASSRPSELAWSELAPLPDPFGVAGAFAGASNGALVVAGGANFPADDPWQVDKTWHATIRVLYAPTDPARARWIDVDDVLPRPLAYGVSVTHDDGIVCAGGSDSLRHYPDVVRLRWNATTQRVEREDLPDLPAPTAFACGAVLDGKLYVVAGQERPSDARLQRATWRLDLTVPRSLMTWDRLEPLPATARPRMLAVCGVQDDALWLFGGVDLESDAGGTTQRAYLDDAWRFDPTTSSWNEVASLPRPAAAAPSPAPTFGQSHLLVVGGDDGRHARKDLGREHPGFERSVLAYHTTTDTWRTVGTVGTGSAPGGGVADAAAPVTAPTARIGDTWLIASGEARPRVRTPRVLTLDAAPRDWQFRSLDWVVLVVYLATLVGIGLRFARRERTTDDFFLAGGRIPWWAAGISIFGTQLSAITFMAVPALVYRTDWVYFLGSLMILGVAPVVVSVYLPFFRRLRVTTAYEYLERRFNLTTRLVGSATFVAFQIGRMGILLYLPSLALAAVTGVDVVWCIVAIGALSTLYTVLGGIEAVVWTDVVQVFVLVGGAAFALAIAVTGASDAVAATGADPLAAAEERGKLRLAHWSFDATAAAIWVVVIGRWFENLVPYTADQTVVQRYLTTHDEDGARRSVWTNALLSVPATLLFFALGTALWTFHRVHPEHLSITATHDDVLPSFVASQLPVGIAGLVIAGLFAASMSSLDSSMNSIATTITTDWYRRLGKIDDEHMCMRTARVLTVVCGVFGTLTALGMAATESRSMWDEYSKIVGLFGGGLAGLFALGIVSRRANGWGALVGFALSAVVLQWAKAHEVHFFLYAMIGFCSCGLLGWLVSAALPRIEKDIDGLTVWTRDSLRPPGPRPIDEL